MRYLIFLMLLGFCVTAQNESPFMMVLGVAQDGGYPHLGCKKECCDKAWKTDSLKKNIVALALADPVTKHWWLFEATPDINKQLYLFNELTKGDYNYLPDGIFITHAHIGHYTGLMQLGREVFNTSEIPVYVLPKLKNYLETNGPWSQLVKLKNIVITELDTSKSFKPQSNISIETFTVPHRDEYSETAGFLVKAGLKKYLFIPDIDKWHKWHKSIVEEVKKVDAAFVDATFYEIDELKGRNINDVPHPFVSETMDLFKNENTSIKSKVVFIHFNHTNKLMRDRSVKEKILKNGYRFAVQYNIY